MRIQELGTYILREKHGYEDWENENANGTKGSGGIRAVNGASIHEGKHNIFRMITRVVVNRCVWIQLYWVRLMLGIDLAMWSMAIIM